MRVMCPYCKQLAKLVSGARIYPHRLDLHQLKYWLCQICGAYVGCHPNSERPLGRLANAELRKAKMEAHKVFDPKWKTKCMTRSEAYLWLAKALGIELKDCHIGEFDLEQCRKVIELCK